MITFLRGEKNMITVYMGYDPRETAAYNVAEFSLKERASAPIAVVPLDIKTLRERGLMWRETRFQNNKMWDVVSEAPQSTEFATSRFLTPILHKIKNGFSGWALFVDCDVIFQADIHEINQYLDPQYAVMCVKHNYEPSSETKMDGQIQTRYSRKNWSSVMAFNCSHVMNDKLTLSMVNSLPGRDLHAFCWLEDRFIGALPKEWNALIGEPGYDLATAKIAHYTLGGPWLGTSVSPIADAVWNGEFEAFKKHYNLAIPGS